MFVQNFEAIENRYECKKLVGEYLEKECGIPPLSIKDNGDYVFSKNEKLEGALLKLPFYLRLFTGR